MLVEAPLEAKGDRVRRALNVLLQTMIALFAGLALAFLLDYLNERLRDAEGAREALDLPILGQIPRAATALTGHGRGRR